MSEKDIVKAIKEHVKKVDGFMQTQGRVFKFRAGPREMLTADQMIKRLDKDKKFRKLIVRMVVDQTIEILGRTPE